MKHTYIKLPAKQKGSALFISLIALVSMMLAGAALIRSVSTANALAGNFAFKEGSLHATDIGVDSAFSQLPNIAKVGNVAIPNQYFPVIQPVDARGVPAGIKWSNVPVVANSNGYAVQYVIERMCQGSVSDPVNGPAPGNLADQNKYCVTLATAYSETGSKASDHATFAGSGVVYYRVTVRATGPHNSVSMVQGTISL